MGSVNAQFKRAPEVEGVELKKVHGYEDLPEHARDYLRDMGVREQTAYQVEICPVCGTFRPGFDKPDRPLIIPGDPLIEIELFSCDYCGSQWVKDGEKEELVKGDVAAFLWELQEQSSRTQSMGEVEDYSSYRDAHGATWVWLRDATEKWDVPFPPIVLDALARCMLPVRPAEVIAS